MTPHPFESPRSWTPNFGVFALLGGIAAVDQKRCTVDEGSFVACEEQDGVCNLLGPAKTPHGMKRHEGLFLSSGIFLRSGVSI